MTKGYKVFNPDWTCREKKYTCPGKFEEDVVLSMCKKGMHFCEKVIDCFRYYTFNPKYHVAEVIAYGNVIKEKDKYCTDKLEIVREIPWTELLDLVNIGRRCTGYKNSGDFNSGDFNSGDSNSGDCNSGNYNSGDCNSGDWNSGDCNSGNCNSGNYNIGDCNSGDCDSGDWNKCSFSNGCFNTIEPKMYLFNKPSEWTYTDWRTSNACHLLYDIYYKNRNIILYEYTKKEGNKTCLNPEVIDGYLKDDLKYMNICWRNLSDEDKHIIMAIPNFDKEIFKEITGIDVDENGD